MYLSIYSLCLVEFETLEAYIKTYQKNLFIQFLNCLATTPIILDIKLEDRFFLS